RRLLLETDARILLIPHVMTAPGHYESDLQACIAVKSNLSELPAVSGEDRLRILPPLNDPRHVKWVIAKTDWFCGTRMHATIAGLSSGVPTAAVAYSLKTRGVFETCGQGEHVADPRDLETQSVVERLFASWNARETSRRELTQTLPRVLEIAR